MDAASLYKDLEREAVIEGEENDLRINRGATFAQLEWQGHGHLVENKNPSREDQEAFEPAFNAACASIARGELDHGEILLKRAKGLAHTFIQNPEGCPNTFQICAVYLTSCRIKRRPQRFFQSMFNSSTS